MTRNEALNQAMDDFGSAHDAYCAGDLSVGDYHAAIDKHEAAQRLYDNLTSSGDGAKK